MRIGLYVYIYRIHIIYNYYKLNYIVSHWNITTVQAQCQYFRAISSFYTKFERISSTTKVLAIHFGKAQVAADVYGTSVLFLSSRRANAKLPCKKKMATIAPSYHLQMKYEFSDNDTPLFILIL